MVQEAPKTSFNFFRQKKHRQILRDFFDLRTCPKSVSTVEGWLARRMIYESISFAYMAIFPI